MTIKELIDKWSINKKMFVKESSMCSYTIIVKNYILPEFGQSSPDEITNGVMQEFFIKLISEKKLSIKSAQDAIIVFKMILSYSVERFGTKYEKFKLQVPSKNKSQKEELEVYTESEQKIIINYLIENICPRNLGILICLCTGLRIGEICGLKWSDVDVDEKCFHIRRTMQRVYDAAITEPGVKKTKITFDLPKTSESYRDIPISHDLYRIIKDFKKVNKDDYFVITGLPKPTEPRVYRNYYYRLLEFDIKIRAIKFHGLRHSFATRMIASGCDVKTTSRILGHADISTTMNLYVHPSMESKSSAINKSMKNLFK